MDGMIKTLQGQRHAPTKQLECSASPRLKLWIQFHSGDLLWECILHFMQFGQHIAYIRRRQTCATVCCSYTIASCCQPACLAGIVSCPPSINRHPVLIDAARQIQHPTPCCCRPTTQMAPANPACSHTAAAHHYPAPAASLRPCLAFAGTGSCRRRPAQTAGRQRLRCRLAASMPPTCRPGSSSDPRLQQDTAFCSVTAASRTMLMSMHCARQCSGDTR